MARLHRVTIVGLGLIGGSLGIAIRKKRLAREVVGYSRKAKTLAQAKRLGAMDAGTSDLRRAIADADLIVLATPVDLIAPMLARVAPHLKRGAVVTDVGSTKAEVVRFCERALPRGAAFVGGHPLAGSERRGIAAARPGLFDGAVCILTPGTRAGRSATAAVVRLWRGVGARVLTMTPAMHDRLLAQASHMPHALAFCLTAAAEPAALAIAPKSFLDATRVAASDAELWDDIFLSNRQAVLAAMRRFDRRWNELRSLLSRGDRQRLTTFLHHASRTRQRLHER